MYLARNDVIARLCQSDFNARATRQVTPHSGFVPHDFNNFSPSVGIEQGIPLTALRLEKRNLKQTKLARPYHVIED